ncbi:hypothetical protein D3C87_1442510 [compost metagenome]
MHDLGELAQHLITPGMAMLVVDRLEVIDVQQQHRKIRALPPGNRNFTADH